ncbi:influenza virus NS1A-binding protein homolog A-like [Paramormyrops kingsleyae]|uniref:Influenza virus NS1A binding protein a n=1 Tax=Paramormyrops kingsleyae TaxID=1676925 RepID=A0A3B3TB85_9TELE|nr:influenza virus NS1A-binding protein homolog A-like [Paramormyrops kingsleyae]XP_023662273.1 influenza virus NS1A-binding protein homolog A-like [Paramormyrops kingsleyae]XP_023662274.1 influenza virus NS1A-binding protein homolog A-like [Paramormyrops kingsleyae]XP_023662275.1 influenza virus NS1A-binding protein homolog A-like [Paramormyrops kingsleyae]
MIPNGCLIFEDDSFLDSTVAKMNALRKSGQFCDVRLQVCGHELMAHRAVLACCSPYLFEIFNSDMEPHGVAHVKFEDLNPEAVEVLLNYAYTAQLKAEKELVRDVYSAARRLKMERVKQICGDYLLSKMDCQCAIPYRNFASRMGDGRLVSKIDGYIQEHLLEISEQDDFLKLPRLKLEVILEDNLNLPSNGKLYSKVIYWLQRCLWENGEPLERMMEEVQTLYYSADHKLHDGSQLEGQTEVFGNDDHIQFLQKKPLRENFQKQASTSSSGSLSPGSVTQLCKHEWKYIASEKTNNSTYLCLAVLNGVLSVIFLHGRGSPHSSPSSTPSLPKSMSFEGQLEEREERLRAPLHYARSGLGTAELDGRLVAAGGYNREECLRTVESYDPKTDRWTFIAPMRTPRARFQMAVLMGQLYVMGGSNGHSDELSCGETYNPHEDEWTPVPELRTNRCNAGVCSLKNKLFVVGGSDPCGQKGLKNCDAFDPVTKIWTSCAPLNIRRHQAAACELSGMMYIIGGAESWNCLNSVERYNPENDTWTLIAPMNVARRGAGVAVYQGRLFVAGGFDGSHALRCVEAYDPTRNEWKMLGSMTSARSNCGMAVLDGAVYAVGGFDGNDFLSSIETYEPQDDNWSPCMEACS